MKFTHNTHHLTQLLVVLTLLHFKGPGNCFGPTTVDASPREVQDVDYEVWGADQSNSVEGQNQLGIRGGFLWVWNKTSIETQIDGGPDAVPLGCKPMQEQGPCDLFDIFPTELKEVDSNNQETTKTLGSLDGVGRWHGIRRDPTTNKYVLANIFAPGGGYVGIIDTRTKESIALFRVTKYAFTGMDAGDRSVHMSFWSAGRLHF
jgi:hypothetical protein